MICNLWDNTPSVLFFVFFSSLITYSALSLSRKGIEELLTTVTSVMTHCLVVTSVVIFTLLLCCKNAYIQLQNAHDAERVNSG